MTRDCGIALPFAHKALPPALYLLVGQVLNEDILLNVEVEREHGSVGGKVVAGKAASFEWKLGWGSKSSGGFVGMAIVVVMVGSSR